MMRTTAIAFSLVLATLLSGANAGTTKEPSQCPVPDCQGTNCKTKLGTDGCFVCDCEKECPVLHCAPQCHPDANAPKGSCPSCICGAQGDVPGAHANTEVPCFTPLLRQTLRRLAELEGQLRHARHLADDNALRLLRIAPPVMESPGGVPGLGGARLPDEEHLPVNDLRTPHNAQMPKDDEDRTQHRQPHLTLDERDNSFRRSDRHQSPMHRHGNHLIQEEEAIQGEPILSETEYDFAICRVRPNTALPADQQQPVHGLISLWQQKESTDLNVHVHVTGFKVDEKARDHRSYMHGMHVHVEGNLTDSCQSTGAHFNPTGSIHGDRRAAVRHTGDLGNIACDKHGETNVVFTDTVASLAGPSSIVGRSINIHAHMDDLGLNPGNPASVSSGNAGPRIACCIIEKVDKLPQLSTKAARRILRDIMQPFSDIESD